MALELYRRKQQEIQDAKDLEQDSKFPVKWAKKQLVAIARNNTTGYIGVDDSNFRWNNLEVGKTYICSGFLNLGEATTSNNTTSIKIAIENGATTLGTVTSDFHLGVSNNADWDTSWSIKFEATDTSVRFNVISNVLSLIRPGAGSQIFLIECPNSEETSQWD